ncbi:MAG: glutamate 5-kinase [Candidatus Eisenbacteria bacterium]|nr:glutamate 5-kinase [Candidatus Eisenbacteria bacterium]MCC7141129.1 glutamate 5-kinase [Candidatus Eisenbacteria bacterium]
MGQKAERIVVKLGTSTLTEGSQRLHAPRILDLARQIDLILRRGATVTLVSSGAVAAGRERLGEVEGSAGIPTKQMLAAIGQSRLMALYESIFGFYDRVVAQVLLTRTDFMRRQSYLNARNTFETLRQHGVIPIVNENDTVATEEIRVGDNDNLSALVAGLVDADLLVLLTDQEGLFTGDPRLSRDAELIREVKAHPIPPELWEAAGGTRSGLGTGGMSTKLQAADLARQAGADVRIASGSAPDVLIRLADGEEIGTRFPRVESPLESRKRYILAGWSGRATIAIDPGAADALGRHGSLLPVGVTRVEGAFQRGDTVQVLSPDGRELGRGLVNYTDDELGRIRGERSERIRELLGYDYGDEVIHRDDFVLTGRRSEET